MLLTMCLSTRINKSYELHTCYYNFESDVKPQIVRKTLAYVLASFLLASSCIPLDSVQSELPSATHADCFTV